MENQIVLSLSHTLTIVGGFGLILGWFYKLLTKKFDKIDADIKEIRADVKDLSQKLSAFEKSTDHRLTVLEMEVKNTHQRLSTIESYLVPRKVIPFKDEEPKEN